MMKILAIQSRLHMDKGAVSERSQLGWMEIFGFLEWVVNNARGRYANPQPPMQKGVVAFTMEKVMPYYASETYLGHLSVEQGQLCAFDQGSDSIRSGSILFFPKR